MSLVGSAEVDGVYDHDNNVMLSLRQLGGAHSHSGYEDREFPPGDVWFVLIHGGVHLLFWCYALPTMVAFSVLSKVWGVTVDSGATRQMTSMRKDTAHLAGADWRGKMLLTHKIVNPLLLVLAFWGSQLLHWKSHQTETWGTGHDVTTSHSTTGNGILIVACLQPIWWLLFNRLRIAGDIMVLTNIHAFLGNMLLFAGYWNCFFGCMHFTVWKDSWGNKVLGDPWRWVMYVLYAIGLAYGLWVVAWANKQRKAVRAALPDADKVWGD